MNEQRVIRAMRECATDHGQGHSYDHEAIQYALKNRLLKFVQWPASLWAITDEGIDWIREHEERTEPV